MSKPITAFFVKSPQRLPSAKPAPSATSSLSPASSASPVPSVACPSVSTKFNDSASISPETPSALEETTPNLRSKRLKNNQAEQCEVGRASEDGISGRERKGEDKTAAKRIEEKKVATANVRTIYDDMETMLEPSWYEALKSEFEKPYWKALKKTLAAEHSKGVKVFPPVDLIFQAFRLCPFDKVRVVILGQDPYHGVGQAEGLCFSVPRGLAVPSSLKNVYKELKSDIPEFTPPKHGNLTHWAKQGVLLLNASLTVQAHKANSHASIGWQIFTDAIIDVLNKKRDHVVFLLWGQYAQKKAKKLNESKHLVLKTVHPSGLSASRGFFGCKHFSRANAFLVKMGFEPVDWNLPP